MPSSGVWCHVAVVIADVSEERIASIILLWRNSNIQCCIDENQLLVPFLRQVTNRFHYDFSVRSRIFQDYFFRFCDWYFNMHFASFLHVLHSRKTAFLLCRGKICLRSQHNKKSGREARQVSLPHFVLFAIVQTFHIASLHAVSRECPLIIPYIHTYPCEIKPPQLVDCFSQTYLTRGGDFWSVDMSVGTTSVV
jgi:hypothetical protein